MERKRRRLVGHIAQAEADGHAIEGIVLERQALGVGDDAFDVAHKARIEQPVTADLEHRRIDVRQDHAAHLADLSQQADRQVAGAAGDVERTLTRPQPGERQR